MMDTLPQHARPARHDHDHDHDHDHQDHGLFGHHHHEDDDAPATPRAKARLWMRFGVAGLVVAGAMLAASAITVGAGQAVVVTQFGRPMRVLTQPGLAWKIPAPVQSAVTVDLRLRTTSSGLQDVGTRDGLRILVQAFAAWRVRAERADIERFLRAVRGDPDEAARQLRSFLGSALQVTASSFALAELVNTDPRRVQLAAFQTRLRTQIAAQMRDIYGMTIDQVGIERLSLPETTMAATVSRMRSERETVAAERVAEGLREAAEIRSEAARDSRIIVARAQTEAAGIEAKARREAADIQAKAYSADPDLYMMLRSLDTLSNMVGPGTRLVLRTDAAPFNVLVQGPPRLALKPPPAGAVRK